MHKLLELDLIRVVEEAAIAAARFMGTGDKIGADDAATTAMRTRLNELDIRGTVVIGEGELDEAPMLYIGEKLGQSPNTGHEIDIAVDPLEGTNLTASGMNNAITVMAMAERSGLLHAPDMYMNKLVVRPEAAGKVDIHSPVNKNLEALAQALNRTLEELVIVVLDRPRHQELIAQIRATGARIKLITDGDILPAIAATVRGTNTHAMMGTGGAPEGVLAAAALKCLNGYMQAHFVIREGDDGVQDREKLTRAGISEPQRVLTIEDLAPGKQMLFAATGVTNGDLLHGVQFFPGGARTNSMVTAHGAGTVRFVESIHVLDRKPQHTPMIFSL